MSLARIGSAEFNAISAAVGALVAGSDRQQIDILTSALGNAAFGAVSPGADATVVINGVAAADGSIPELMALGTFMRLAWGKAIIDIESAKDVTVQNLVLSNAAVANDSNGAAIRLNGNSETVRVKNIVARNNEDGILGGTTKLLTIEDSLFDNNGQASNASRQGYSHNLYLDGQRAEIRRTTAQNSEYGHDLKSRCKETIVEQAVCSGSKQGRALDLSNGGVWESSHSIYAKPASAIQNNLVHLAAEGVNDGRAEKYTSTNDLFQIDIQPEGRALQFICNDGNVECVLTDPKFLLGGVEISDDEAAKYFAGKSPVRIVLTGQPRGPQLPSGRQGAVPKAIPQAGAAADPAPTAATPAPAPTPATSPSTTPAGSWVHLANEGDPATVAPNTTVRYGLPGLWVTKVLSGSFQISNDTFGSDPAYGSAKIAEVWVPAGADTAPPAATPAPVATPTTADAPGTVNVGTALAIGAKAFLEALGYTVTKP